MTRIKCGGCGLVSEARVVKALIKYECLNCSAVNEVSNIPIKEWVGFNFNKFKEEIMKFIQKDEFETLLAKNEFDKERGMLTSTQISRLKGQLKIGFKREESIREIARRIENNVGIRELYKTINGQIAKDKEGNPIILASKKTRAVQIARTEVTRVATGGSLGHYEEAGIKRVSFVASIGDRTCPICDSLNGRIFEIQQARGVIPAHTNCRCSFVAITEDRL